MKIYLLAYIFCSLPLASQACRVGYGLPYHIGRCDLIIAGEVIEVVEPNQDHSSGPKYDIGKARIRVLEVLYHAEHDRGYEYKEIVIPIAYGGVSTDPDLYQRKGIKSYYIVRRIGSLFILSHPEQQLPYTEENKAMILSLLRYAPQSSRMD
ncbi:MAG: hypothetical protein HC904_10835 [Blastochloris sp.]|nr:hypothetical protein [Blastochloris sp.]